MNYENIHKILNNPKFQKPFTLFLRLFYSKMVGMNPFHILIISFIPQKILRINGCVPWPVHFTSRVLYHKNITVGNNSAPGFNSGCYIQARNGINIGHNLRMGPNVGLISANHDVNDYDKWTNEKSIEIGNNVWIGMNSVILPSVKIGDNVVIGANSVVKNNIPSNSIAAGVPARVIKRKKDYQGKDYNKVQ